MPEAPKGEDLRLVLHFPGQSNLHVDADGVTAVPEDDELGTIQEGPERKVGREGCIMQRKRRCTLGFLVSLSALL